MRFKTLFFLAVSTTAALAQAPASAPVRRPDTAIVPLPADAKPALELEFSPSVTLTNGLIRAKVFLPYKPDSFYQGTRFDNFGTVGSLIYGGQEFYSPWFEHTANVRDFVVAKEGIVAGPASADAGPVEEFSTDNKALGYDATPVGGTFIKIGVGILRKPDDQPYSAYRAYALVDTGKVTVKNTKTEITFTQNLFDAESGYGYHYVKTLRLVPGKPQMVIDHSLKNTGKKDFATTVYDHNFLTLSPGNADLQVTVPYTLTPRVGPQSTDGQPPDDLLKIGDHTITFQRPIALTERGGNLTMAGFGNTAADYAFEIKNLRTGAGVAVKGDQPMIRMSMFMVHSIPAVEPRISLDLPVGTEKHWAYTYTYTAPKTP